MLEMFHTSALTAQRERVAASAAVQTACDMAWLLRGAE